MCIGDVWSKHAPNKTNNHFSDKDGTPFRKVPMEAITAELRRLGYDGYGNEVMMDGMTGDMLESPVFIGPMFYQRLKHMAGDKIHTRSTGVRNALTHQPAEGRAHDGGNLRRKASVKAQKHFSRANRLNCTNAFASLRYRRQHIQIQGNTKNN
jgi:DNA-directed RNA polymerase beta subunit